MRKYFEFTAILFLFAAMIACGGENTQKTEQTTGVSEDKNEMQEVNNKGQEKPMENKSSLSLNNGEKWIANEETTKGVRNMQTHMADYTQLNEPEECKRLQSALQEEFNYIISKCTMKGEAHDQLHNFLIVIQENLKGLASKDLDRCKESYEKIDAQLAVYDAYFK